MSRPNNPYGGDAGASLVIALVFVLLISLVMLAVVTLSGTNIANTTNLQNGRTLEYAAEGGVQAAIQAVRYMNPASTTAYCNASPAYRPPAPIDATVVYCQMGNPTYARVLTFQACPPAVSAGVCTANSGNVDVVSATVQISDLASGCFGPSCYNPPATSGTSVTIASWIVDRADR